MRLLFGFAEHTLVAMRHVFSDLSRKISVLLAVGLLKHFLHDALTGMSHAAVLSKQPGSDRIV